MALPVALARGALIWIPVFFALSGEVVFATGSWVAKNRNDVDLAFLEWSAHIFETGPFSRV